ncbi:2-oxo-3-hexenedioate decarboxylase [Paraburkholderia caballeronis]|uniref:4-oxalocrotonate decarboxylase n=1 Tax=Paraburkholderia caballeronis TaxID=416943 RepID=A0A1H7VV42_9BURK|nr:2-oxo-3-hexenedioate decarboxylase [Paraburkholderia caballeronis]PXW14660.1 4-oxalocrotonate decarboxylase [Paraburkholderia caballeronis]PXW93488.1 4-oxalocrotonate decarboxylase [Paraburkholderia caballeronis]RAJ88347.1 4-oxalocrotonate decarboxylase [Paraburkholderia caballeronis]SEE22981.1 4-oxalocrotonate decarboxylase [Paraburkholderia caballeronis]SEM13212.1 4-oxalocrotonate decarboxylase [Paraburkholderia caballeronis]
MNQSTTLDETSVGRLAALLHDAETNAREVTKITDALPDLTQEDAYAIQHEILRIRLANGERLSGRKMGLTSFAKMKQMGVERPIYGFLTDRSCLVDGAELPMRDLIHPKVEAEISVITSHELRGPGCTATEALAAIDMVYASIEVIDSRYRDFRFDLVSVIADNTSAARYVIGAKGAPAALLDLRNLGVVLERNGEVLATGAGAAVLGHPAASLAALVNMLAAENQSLPAGTLVMTGGVTEAFRVDAGDTVHVTVQGVGTAELKLV